MNLWNYVPLYTDYDDYGLVERLLNAGKAKTWTNDQGQEVTSDGIFMTSTQTKDAGYDKAMEEFYNQAPEGESLAYINPTEREILNRILISWFIQYTEYGIQ